MLRSYAFLKDNLCIGLTETELSLESNSNYVEVESYDNSYIGRKYDRDKGEWA